MKFPRKQRGAHGQVETTGADGGDQGSWCSWPGSGCGPEGSLLASKVMMPEKGKDGWVESILSPASGHHQLWGRWLMFPFCFLSSLALERSADHGLRTDPRLASWRGSFAKGGLE